MMKTKEQIRIKKTPEYKCMIKKLVNYPGLKTSFKEIDTGECIYWKSTS